MHDNLIKIPNDFLEPMINAMSTWILIIVRL